jgi:hypothetical protein
VRPPVFLLPVSTSCQASSTGQQFAVHPSAKPPREWGRRAKSSATSSTCRPMSSPKTCPRVVVQINNPFLAPMRHASDDLDLPSLRRREWMGDYGPCRRYPNTGCSWRCSPKAGSNAPCARTLQLLCGPRICRSGRPQSSGRCLVRRLRPAASSRSPVERRHPHAGRRTQRPQDAKARRPRVLDTIDRPACLTAVVQVVQ